MQFIKEQTPEICLEAVKQNGYALRFVKEQTSEICLETVKQDGDALQYVNSDFFEEEVGENDEIIELNGKKYKLLNDK